MKCKFESRGQQCGREAVKGWMTCARHYSAGVSRKQYREAQKRKAERDQNRDRAARSL